MAARKPSKKRTVKKSRKKVRHGECSVDGVLLSLVLCVVGLITIRGLNERRQATFSCPTPAQPRAAQVYNP